MIEPEFAWDVVDWKDHNAGYEAGWRRDELIGVKSKDFMDGYDAGKYAREEADRRDGKPATA